MKIERMNENQIRCTLTREDLARRHLNMNELAYGTEKTQNLFREMLREADYTCGFETGDMPLMIEAIPVSSDNIVLIITKIDDPEELDTRFSRFSPSNRADSYEEDEEDPEDEELSDMLGASDSRPIPTPSFREVLDQVSSQADDRLMAFSMKDLGSVMDLAGIIRSFKGDSSLYKANDGRFVLALRRGSEDPEKFRSICQTAMEFGKGSVLPPAGAQALSEHGELLIADHAVLKLGGDF
jgi:adapter protein MecA 1/2